MNQLDQITFALEQTIFLKRIRGAGGVGFVARDLRDVLHKWAKDEIHTSNLLTSILIREGLAMAHEGGHRA